MKQFVGSDWHIAGAQIMIHMIYFIELCSSLVIVLCNYNSKETSGSSEKKNKTKTGIK